MTSKRNSKTLADIVRLVQQDLAKSSQLDPRREAALHAERQEIEHAKEGWLKSLARSDLPDSVRRQIESRFAVAEERLGEIEDLLIELEMAQQRSELTVDETVVQQKLGALQESLQSENATLMNFQLAQHIDRIECRADGKVVVRICKLGVLADPAALIARLTEGIEPAKRVRGKSKRRLRKRSKLAVLQEGTFLEHCEVLEFALNPHRFEGLPEHLFWTFELETPVRKCWAEAHALEVYERRLNHGQAKKLTLEALAKIFDKSTPTIRKAIRIAEAEMRKSEAA